MPSDKSFLPLPSLLGQTSTTPHTEAHPIEFAKAMHENKLRKPKTFRQKFPPSSTFAYPNLHHTTPHTEAHRHKVRRSCAWSLETDRSRLSHNPKLLQHL
ncbi:hypothetical protein ACB092_01G070300 [Castanea dentata]